MTTIKQPVLIRKTIMTPNGLSLSLPDFKVNISKASKSSFEFYKKKNSNYGCYKKMRPPKNKNKYFVDKSLLVTDSEENC